MKGLTLFATKLRRRPLHSLASLGIEYLGYFAGCAFALLLISTRAPMRALDGIANGSLRRRFIDAVARISPG